MNRISLKSSHIYIEHDIVTSIFGNIHYAYVTFIKEQKNLLITPVDSQWFVKIYKPTQFLLKSRNLKGDKTLAIREILIDNDLSMLDRNLDFTIIKKTNLIKISLK
ncbi:hypothetical protein MC378_03660 [Polaribacter sp. MSW13]|uniref:Uncharacterized protein n=1 Tax=Polaribacter marinus TaxID=2916838 RepID=A0A9X2AI60_9FLAO|nr:hypothetical protein [Polaribacter marinus]MCI2228251.1 hypothetical protein [Polaribacter marinus]